MVKICFLIAFLSTSVSFAEVSSVKASTLVPSKASAVKKAREDAEIATESAILEKIEAQRLRDERKRIQELTGSSSSPKVVVKPSPSLERAAHSRSLWRFGEKAFISLGVGSVQYPGVKNISSVRYPAFFLSFGGYARSNVIIDFTLFQSQHFVEVHKSSHPVEGVFQPGASMAFKYSFFSGRVKPYVGVSGVYKASRWFPATKSGNYIKDIRLNLGQKQWYQAFDGGVTTGIDVAFGNRLGINMDFRYHVNLYTEVNRSLGSTASVRHKQPLDQRDSVSFSGNLRFYFN